MIAKELTKLRSFYRFEINNLKLFDKSIKGEFTIVISDKNIKEKSFDKNKIINKAKKFLKKYTLRDTVDMILETEKVNKRSLSDLFGPKE